MKPFLVVINLIALSWVIFGCGPTVVRDSRRGACVALHVGCPETRVSVHFGQKLALSK